VVVSNDAAGEITFRFTFANRSKLVANNDSINLCIDTDRSSSTGLQNPSICPPGAEYVLYVIWQAGVIFTHWNGSRMDAAQHNTLRTSETGGPTISINRSELSGTSGFNFQVSTEPPGDTAPNSGTWTYVLQAGAERAAAR
jgi:heme-degrading monooxygenase HmoA